MTQADKQTRRAALNGEVFERVEYGKRIVDVYGGQIAFDGETVTLTRSFMPRGSVSFQAADVRAIEWRAARRFLNGKISFVVPDASDRPQAGNYWTKTGKDERERYALAFMAAQTEVLRSLCDAIEMGRR